MCIIINVYDVYVYKYNRFKYLCSYDSQTYIVCSGRRLTSEEIFLFNRDEIAHSINLVRAARM